MPSLNELISEDNNQQEKTLTDVQRLLVQNLFDTQKERRKAYLNRLGFEMNPKDDNEYRPVGSDSPYIEIDPGISSTLKKGGIKEISKEMLKDVGDIGYDVLSGLAVTAASKGTQAGLSGGGPLLAIAGSILGGAAGYEAAEKTKKAIGDVLLDKDVPLDKDALIVQSFFAGVADPLFKGGKKLLKEGYGVYLSNVRNSIINAAKASGNGLNENILEKAIQNPEMFSQERVSGATNRLKETYKQIFGITDPIRVDAPDNVVGGVFGKKMNVLNAQANSEIERLAKEKAANFTPEEILEPLLKKAEELNKKYRKTEDEQAAYSYLKKVIGELKKVSGTTAEINPEITNAAGQSIAELGSKKSQTLNFKQAREFLSSIQSEISARDNAGNFLKPEGRVLAGAFGGGDGILSIINKKAKSLGSNLPDINMERSRVLNAYNTAVDVYSPQNIMNTFVGKDSIKKELFKDASREMDEILGTNLTKTIEDGSMQRVVEQLYENPKAFGSGLVNAEMTSGAIKGAIKGGTAGAVIGAPGGGATMGIGAGIGAIAGGAAGANEAATMASPVKALEKLRSVSTGLGDLKTSLEAPQTLSVPTSVIAAEVGSGVGNAINGGEVDLNQMQEKQSTEIPKKKTLQDLLGE